MNKERSAYIGCFYSLVGIVLLLIAALLFGSCRSVKYVPVVEHHTETITKTDSIIQRDTILDKQSTIIREVDSATMAQYGIELKNMQRAWLIQTDRLQKQVSELMKNKSDSVTKRDSIPVPYPVTVEVPAQLSWWQQARLHLANAILWALLIVCAWWLIRKKTSIS